MYRFERVQFRLGRDEEHREDRAKVGDFRTADNE